MNKHNFRGYGPLNPCADILHKNEMREFLRALGLFPVGITADDIECLSAALAANHGTPDKIYMNPRDYEALKKLNKTLNKLEIKTTPKTGGTLIIEDLSIVLRSVTFDMKNLKP